MPPPHMQELEQNICDILTTIQMLEFNDSGSLVIHFGEDTSFRSLLLIYRQLLIKRKQHLKRKSLLTMIRLTCNF